jgi:hypothetical protein
MISRVQSEVTTIQTCSSASMYVGVYIHTKCTGQKVNMLGGHSIGHSKQKSVYVHVSYSERFPR